ncbi:MULTISPECIES: DUF4199 domain-containing protein [unclassified Roseateles]|uniref:DUF4199 domain-containing protein n=1 Tax=unclassified Roseateles TaxID=2626991 RepID=UPI0006F8D3B6|nr:MULTISPECIES: DUF4199 domain-containing protein [unclassified Roseateles]KQW51265.1 hypothetical protein ASC81_01030 [Pelomonas sp. Root405]KRA77497.1 hypothetical protein ASD88_01030 [Pelomonas sp. Root662]
MLKTVLSFGVAAGLLAGVPLFALIVLNRGAPPEHGMVIGYLIMLVALTLVFVAIKRRRDSELGGVIRFWPAFLLGLGISLTAGVVYAAAWEVTLAVTKMDFGTEWAKVYLAQGKAKGLPEAELAKLAAEMDEFKRLYANPLYRFPMTMAEIVPVGLLVSLISAALLRNPRFMASRRR